MMNSGRKSSRIDNFSERQYKFYFYYLMIIIYVLRFIMRGLVMCVSGMIIIYVSRFIMRGLVMCVNGMDCAYVYAIYFIRNNSDSNVFGFLISIVLSGQS